MPLKGTLAAAVCTDVERRQSHKSVSRQHKLDSLERVRKGGFEVHLKRARSEDENESGYAIEEAEKAVRDIRRATRR